MTILIKGARHVPYLSVSLLEIISLNTLKDVKTWRLFRLTGVSNTHFNILEKEHQINTAVDGLLYTNDEMFLLARNLVQLIDFEATGYVDTGDQLSLRLEDGDEWEIDVNDDIIVSELMTLDGAQIV